MIEYMTIEIVPQSDVVPFAVGFMEEMDKDDILDASGHYDDASQTWVLDKNNTDSSTLMTGFNPERPPTTCQRMTKVGHGHYTTDTFVDD